LGGEHFEPEEENPMIGWRGASRYYSEAYKEAFGLECKAIRRVREKDGPEERCGDGALLSHGGRAESVKAVMEEYGLERGKEGLELFLMAEIPSNIIMAEEFSAYIDGFSIGSNDLTQLTLGLDRDSALVSAPLRRTQPGRKAHAENADRNRQEAPAPKWAFAAKVPATFPTSRSSWWNWASTPSA
jgi:pyruvate,water dikinase